MNALDGREIITYSLKNGDKCSCWYTRAVSALTDALAVEGERLLGDLVDGFLSTLPTAVEKAPRSRLEYIYDLLVMGTLWRIYGRSALDFSPLAARLLERLSSLREGETCRKHPRWKRLIDRLRGPLMGLLIPYQPASAAAPLPLTSRNLGRLLDWLSASGRFAQEVKRLQVWAAYFARAAPELAPDFALALNLADWFEPQSMEALGCFTSNVETFLARTQPAYRGREDYIFCGRRRVEYHQGMVGSEVLNRALREVFLRSTRKAVLVPPCMRALPDEQCQATPSALGARCAGCTPGCRVHQLTLLGEKHGFAVLTLPDDLRVYSASSFQGQSAGSLGVIGVSCALTNAPGGWQAREMDIAAQGVILDYCGCTYHWHKQGIPTSVNFHQILRILNDNQPEKE